MNAILFPADFSALHLTLDPETGDLLFDWKPIKEFCMANGIDPEQVKYAPNHEKAALLLFWYSVHRQAGGAPDPVMADALKEIRLIREANGQLHKPGHA